MERQPILALTDLPPGASRLVTVDGKEVALFNVEGRLYAVGNRCPHRSGPLSRGRIEPIPDAPGGVSGEVSSNRSHAPGGVSGAASDSGSHTPGGAAVRCPIHGWLFDLLTGRCLTRSGAGIPTFPVSCEEGRICLGPQQGEAVGPAVSGHPELVEG